MVYNALRSLQTQTYKSFELAFVDDSGPECPGGLAIFTDAAPAGGYAANYYCPYDSEQQKIEQGGSRFGEYWNLACEKSEADIALMLCDDDALHPEYLEKLDEWFTSNPQHTYCHSHVIPFDPFTEKPDMGPRDYWLNHNVPIRPGCVVDSSQVAWRLSRMKEAGIKFPSPQTSNLDAALYGQMFEHWGMCMPTGFVGQYKGTFGNQLSYRQFTNPYAVIDLPEKP
jgi:hypothetical protein